MSWTGFTGLNTSQPDKAIEWLSCVIWPAAEYSPPAEVSRLRLQRSLMGFSPSHFPSVEQQPRAPLCGDAPGLRRDPRTSAGEKKSDADSPYETGYAIPREIFRGGGNSFRNQLFGHVVIKRHPQLDTTTIAAA